MKRLVIFFAERSLIVNIVTVGILIAGVMFLVSANREAFPRVEYDFVLIHTLYPGATADDIEKHITIPVENEVREVDGLEEVTSSSTESSSLVKVKLDPDLENKDKVITEIRTAVDNVNDLPSDAEDPMVIELKSDLMPVIELSVVRKAGVHNDKEERELRKAAKSVEDDLLDMKGIAKVDRQGYRDREMVVEVNPKKLAYYHVSVTDVILALKNRNLNFPAGLVRSGNDDVMVRTIGEVQDTKELENVIIKANDLGFWVRIKDIGIVKDTYDEMTILNKHTGRQAVTLTVIKKKSADIITVAENVKKLKDKYRKKYGDKYDYFVSNDFSFYVQRRLNVLVNNAIVGMILVAGILLISLGWRIALVTVLGIPVAFAGTFIWMGRSDVTVNLLSMFGLILVLGMVVDDAIIVAENIYRHLEEGESVKDAVINGTTEVITPVLGTILTTIAAFSPLMFMSGIMGKFLWTLPAVVSVALIASWIEAMFILPSHVKDIELRRKSQIVPKKSDEEATGIYLYIQNTYVKMLRYVLTHKFIIFLLITTIFFGSAYFGYKHIDFKLFPQDKIEQFVVKMEAEKGLSLEAMNKRVEKMEKLIVSLPKNELESYITQVGIVRESAMDPNSKTDTNFAYIMVNLTPEEDRDRKAADIILDLRKLGKELIKKNFIKVHIKPRRNGPPTGQAVSILVKGDNPRELKEVSKKFQKYMKTIKGLKDIQDTYEEGKDEFRIYVNQKTAGIAGISVYDVATTVRTCFKGTVATKIKKTDEEIEIRVIYPEALRNDLKSIWTIDIPNKLGNLVPLKELVTFERKPGISKITREDYKRSIRVTAEIEDGSDISSVKVNALLMKKFANIKEKHPQVQVDYSGEYADTKESITELGRSFIIAIMVIYFILVALFRSLIHPMVVMSIIPLTLVGVIWAFFFHGLVFSQLAVMGIVGLAGVIVNDSIVLVDFIKSNRAKGMSSLDASLHAGAKRIRAIFLTTITTFLGLLPTAYGWGGYDPFLKPMAVSMSWGLLFGTVVTLFATPLMYNILTGARRMVTGKERMFGQLESESFVHQEEVEQHDHLIHEIENQIWYDMDVKYDELSKEIEERMVKEYGLKKKVTRNKRVEKKN